MMEQDIATDPIDFSEFESPYFKVTDQPTDIVIEGWTTGTTEIQGKRVRGVLSTVTSVNGEKTKKEFFMGSKRLIQAMRPFIEEAQKEGKTSISVRVYKSGSGFNTQYTVKAT